MASTAFLSSLQSRLSTRRETRNAWLLVSVRSGLTLVSSIRSYAQAVTSCALGKGPEWVPLVYQHAVKGVPASTPSPTPRRLIDEHNERRKVFRIIKEALLKSCILCGVARVIETSLALGESVDANDIPHEDDAGYRTTYQLDDTNRQRGRDGLQRVYKKPTGPILERFKKAGASELQWLSEELTYGLLVAPCTDTPDADERAVLTFAETEIVVLACLASMKAPMETRWHLLGALRSGLTREEVGGVQQAVEEIAEACGVQAPAKDMPHVSDILDNEI